MRYRLSPQLRERLGQQLDRIEPDVLINGIDMYIRAQGRDHVVFRIPDARENWYLDDDIEVIPDLEVLHLHAIDAGLVLAAAYECMYREEAERAWQDRWQSSRWAAPAAPEPVEAASWEDWLERSTQIIEDSKRRRE